MAIYLNIFTGVLQHPSNMFSKFNDSLNSHQYNVTQISETLTSDLGTEELIVGVMNTSSLTPVYVLVIQILSGLFTFIFANLACKVIVRFLLSIIFL